MLLLDGHWFAQRQSTCKLLRRKALVKAIGLWVEKPEVILKTYYSTLITWEFLSFANLNLLSEELGIWMNTVKCCKTVCHYTFITYVLHGYK